MTGLDKPNVHPDYPEGMRVAYRLPGSQYEMRGTVVADDDMPAGMVAVRPDLADPLVAVIHAKPESLEQL